MLGLSAGLPAARRACCQRRLSASPPSIQASDEPIVDVPIAPCGSGACQSLASIFQHLVSIAAVAGYSSLSIMFLSNVSAYSFDAAGSIQVVTNVARFRRALPSSIAWSCTTWYAVSRSIGSAASADLGRSVASPSREQGGLGSVLLRLGAMIMLLG